MVFRLVKAFPKEFFFKKKLRQKINYINKSEQCFLFVISFFLSCVFFFFFFCLHLQLLKLTAMQFHIPCDWQPKCVRKVHQTHHHREKEYTNQREWFYAAKKRVNFFFSTNSTIDSNKTQSCSTVCHQTGPCSKGIRASTPAPDLKRFFF